MRHSSWLLGALLLTACGPTGVLSGKVLVEGGNAGGVAVIVYGPQSAAAVTADDGTFSVQNLPDGKYVVRATVRGTDVEEQTATTTLTQGKASPEPVLTFRSSTAKVSGRVVMADGSDAVDLTVTAVGPETRGARTDGSGAFNFEGLKTGAYVVSVEAKDTKEGRVAVGVNASGTVPAIELRLTPVGRLGGQVTFNAAPAAGVPVMVTGTSLSATTDEQGRFSLEGVPTGPQSILARLGSEPFFRSASAMVTVLKGANPDVMLALSDDAPKTGTVTGVITFHGPRTPRDITITVPGTSATTQPALNGAFSLSVPVGVWDVVATAALHPAKVLGRVTVVEGQSTALVGQELSWYRPIWRSSTPITGGPVTAAFGLTSPDTLQWSLVAVRDASGLRWALVNAVTGEFRIVAYGDLDAASLSQNAKYAGWAVANTAFVYELSTGQYTSYFDTRPVTDIGFSSDESAFFIERGNVTLTRIKFSGTPASETFPSSGLSPGIVQGTADRWFVREPGTTNDVRLVTPRTDVARIFPNVNGTFSMSPTAWALSNCTTAVPSVCALHVLGPASESPATTPVAITNPTANSVVAFNNSTRNSRADFPCFAIAGTSAICVNTASNNAVTTLPFVPSQFKLNEAGDRVIWVHASGLNSVVREESFPPTGTGSPLGTNASGFATGWLSPTRAWAADASTVSPRNVHFVKAGVATTDNDIGSQAIINVGPLLVFPGSSGTPAKWKAVLGDSPTRAVDVPTSFPVIGSSARANSTAAPARYGSFSFGSTSAWIIDDTAVRQTLTGGHSGSALALRSGTVEYTSLERPGGLTYFFAYATNAILEAHEPGGANAIVGSIGNHAWLSLQSDGHTIAIGRFQ